VIPIPFSFQARWFQPSSYTTPRSSRERDSFFKYNGPSDNELYNEFNENDLFRLLDQARRHANRVHMIVFPELALTKSQFGNILKSLLIEKKRGARNRDEIPMVLAGVRDGLGDDSRLGSNKAVLATFFAGRWYQLEQDKQHRWRLDEKQ